MSLVDPEAMVKTMNRLDMTFGHMNKAVAGLTRLIDKNIRAQTKVVAAANKTHGVMLGVVADLELMGGAFGKVKSFLANLLLPIDEGTPKLFKFTQGLLSLSNAYTNLYIPFKKHLQVVKEQGKAEKGLKLIASTKLTKRLMEGAKGLQIFEKSTLAELGQLTPLGRIPLPRGAGIMPKGTKAPEELTVLKPLTKPGLFKRIGEGTKHLTEMGSGKMKAGMKMWKTNVTTPLKQIASGGIGLGFQVHIIMALMQAFASLFAIFQPVMDIVGLLMERLSIGFIPIVTMLIDIITSPPILAMIDALAETMSKFFEIFKPLTPIIIAMIGIALMPLMMILNALTPYLEMLGMIFGVVFEAISPLFDLLSGALAPVFGVLAKLLGLLLIVGLYPLVGAIYVVGIAIAALMDLFTDWTGGNVRAWNTMMLPIVGALNMATVGILGSFQTGTDFVPQTGIYMLERGEGVSTPEENRAGRTTSIVIHMHGSYLGADMEDLSNRIAKKLSLYEF